MNDTICAISTARGIGAIAVIRVSGDDAISIVDSVFSAHRTGVRLSDRKTHTVTYGTISDCYGEIVDDVLVSVFRHPNSFTGEDSVEVSVHGSSYVQQEVLRLLCSKGARLAMPGEFSRRAFANGKFDLAQAEAIADLIASQSKMSHKLAISQMSGRISEKLADLHNRLVELSALLELELDFSEEDVEFADRKTLIDTCVGLQGEISSLSDSFRLGNALKNGIPVAIVGNTNAGKSTLLNLLAEDQRAIVSDIDGTTRDAIEVPVNIDGVLFRFIDTAGLRETSDEIERLGIEITKHHIQKADIVINLIDASDERTAALLNGAVSKILNVINKIDKVGPDRISELEKQYDNAVCISAKNDVNIDVLKARLIALSKANEIAESDVIITNERHYQCLRSAGEALNRTLFGLKNGIATDLVAEDLRLCNRHIGEITGQITSDTVLHTIFSRFCIGK
ncbi:MAG: tRNA uridine-5-carboxymethylaminomethyl(34) synthesis GTPase MnmE [Paludibacteraceae bacterium]|nr:tRNA uridine-5-carboxymethylaminomethyl(34) synthesis GTPase MnmE [Paludibacteraceae bacterium]